MPARVLEQTYHCLQLTQLTQPYVQAADGRKQSTATEAVQLAFGKYALCPTQTDYRISMSASILNSQIWRHNIVFSAIAKQPGIQGEADRLEFLCKPVCFSLDAWLLCYGTEHNIVAPYLRVQDRC